MRQPRHLAVAAVEHAGQREQQARDQRRPQGERTCRGYTDGEGQQRDLVRCYARNESKQRGSDEPVREDAVEPHRDCPIQRLAGDTNETTPSLAALATFRDLEPPVRGAGG
jgi:hypothetical protein